MSRFDEPDEPLVDIDWEVAVDHPTLATCVARQFLGAVSSPPEPGAPIPMEVTRVTSIVALADLSEVAVPTRTTSETKALRQEVLDEIAAEGPWLPLHDAQRRLEEVEGPGSGKRSSEFEDLKADQERYVKRRIQARYEQDRLDRMAGGSLAALADPQNLNQRIQSEALLTLAKSRFLLRSHLDALLPGGDTWVREALKRLEELGLIASGELDRCMVGKPTTLWRLTPAGWEVGMAARVIPATKRPDGAAPAELEPGQERPLRHDLLTMVHVIALRRYFVASGASDFAWHTPALKGICRALPPEPRTWGWPEGGALTTVQTFRRPQHADGRTEDVSWWEKNAGIEADAALDVTSADGTRTRRMFLEVDVRRSLAKNLEKVVAYDRALSGWLMTLPAYRSYGRYGRYESYPTDPKRYGALPETGVRLQLTRLREGAPDDIPAGRFGEVNVPNRPLVVFVMRDLRRLATLRDRADAFANAVVAFARLRREHGGRHLIFFSTYAEMLSDAPRVIGLPPLTPYVRNQEGLADDCEWRLLRVPPSLFRDSAASEPDPRY